MAFSTEFIMGGGGSSIEVTTREQVGPPPSTAIPVGEPYVIDKAGVYGVAVFGSMTDAPTTSGNVRLELRVNGAMVGASAAQADTDSVGCFLPRYLVAGDIITMAVSGGGLFSTVLYEPTVAVAPIDTVGDGTAHTGGPIQLAINEWRTLASHTVARSGVVLVDYGVNFASTSSMQSRITVNGTLRIGNPIRAVNERWYRALSVNAGDVVAAQAYSSSFTSSQRVVNNWTITFR